MHSREFQAQIRASIESALEKLRTSPDDLLALWLADFLGAMRKPLARQPGLEAARERFAKRRAKLDAKKLARELRAAGAAAFLVKTWEELGQAHFDGAELLPIADELIALVDDATTLGKLPYAVGNWLGSWNQAGRNQAAASERLAAAALELDPEEEGALYLFAQEDFLERANKSRPGKKLSGPPVAKKPAGKHVARLEKLLASYQSGEHPLDLAVTMETIPVDSPEVVAALIRGIACPEWRGGLACIEALGGAKVEHAKVVEAFCEVLRRGEPRQVEHVAMALHYGLRERGVGALDALIEVSQRLVAQMKEDEDYSFQWPLRAILTLAPHAEGEARERVRACIDRTLAESDASPAWKKERLHEFIADGAPLARKLAPKGKATPLPADAATLRRALSTCTSATELARLLESPAAAELTDLSFSVPDAAQAPAALVVAALRRPALGTAVAKAIAGAGSLRGLRRLGLGAIPVGREGVRALAASPSLAGLAELELAVDEDEVQEIVAAHAWRQLRALELVGSFRGDAGARLLAGAETLASLRCLRIRHLVAEAVAALAASPHLAALEDLDLGNGRFGDEGARLIASSATFGRLTGLNLHLSHVGAPGIAALAASPHLTRLARVDLRWSERTADGLIALAGSALRSLTRLELAYGHAQTAAVVALAGSPVLDSVEYLDLAGNEAGQAGGEALLHSPHLGSLVELDVTLNGMPLAMEERFRSSPKLPRLKTLRFREQVEDDDR